MDLGGDRRESSVALICANLQSMRQRDGSTQQATFILSGIECCLTTYSLLPHHSFS